MNSMQLVAKSCRTNLLTRISATYLKQISDNRHTSKSFSSIKDDEDDVILEDFVNRNPRNMEMLRLARKPRGHCLDSPTINYWYRLEYKTTNKFIKAFVSHHTGKIVIEASTSEAAFRNQLYSMQDVSAAMNLGRVLAHRCLQAGITDMHTELDKEANNSQKLTSFLKAMTDVGINLNEPPQLLEKQFFASVKQFPACPWEVTEDDLERLDANLSKPLPDKYFDFYDPK